MKERRKRNKRGKVKEKEKKMSWKESMTKRWRT